MGLFEVGIALMNNNISSVLTNHQTRDNTMKSKFNFYLHPELLTYEQAISFLNRKNEEEGKGWRIPTLEEVFEELMKVESGSLRGYLSDIEAEDLEVWVHNPNTAEDGYRTCTIATDRRPTKTKSPKSQPRVVLFISPKKE